MIVGLPAAVEVERTFDTIAATFAVDACVLNRLSDRASCFFINDGLVQRSGIGCPICPAMGMGAGEFIDRSLEDLGKMSKALALLRAIQREEVSSTMIFAVLIDISQMRCQIVPGEVVGLMRHT